MKPRNRIVVTTDKKQSNKQKKKLRLHSSILIACSELQLDLSFVISEIIDRALAA